MSRLQAPGGVSGPRIVCKRVDAGQRRGGLGLSTKGRPAATGRRDLEDRLEQQVVQGVTSAATPAGYVAISQDLRVYLRRRVDGVRGVRAAGGGARRLRSFVEPSTTRPA